MSVTFASPRITSQTFSALEQAILETLAYSDVFDYPLSLDELHRYLILSATKEEIENCIVTLKQVNQKNQYYYLLGRDEIVATRIGRESKSRKAFNRSMRYGKILGRFPFVHMVALTGSLAMLNLSTEIDMDYMLITQPNRLWIARAFAVTFGRIMRLFGDRICVNLLISENNLYWSHHDLYSAREICQMIPISGFDTHCAFRVANLWTSEFLPNAIMELMELNIESNSKLFDKQKKISALQNTLQKLEFLAMKIQLKIISRHSGASDETKFTPDICQGNFHHHRQWTQIEYQRRLDSLLPMGEGQGMRE